MTLSRLHLDPHLELNAFLPPPQGEEDQVVPPNQAVDMYQALKKKGLSTALVLFFGEQHGFRQVIPNRALMGRTMPCSACVCRCLP